ncbi:zinc finger and BTB domain-containing protein 49-like [Macrobrachium nipponense]|uniref:zinc finger and BTB domain-containing protein 49-like n=1 Tax=Macrobrachium nipponense TaxID=159736 RepID=UPI0030C7C1E1
MDDECLSLTWNNHGATYRSTLSVLREENTLTDVTLACDGKTFAAHKLVLVTCSDYFRHILGDVPCQHPIVYLRGIAAKEMQALIDFMYTGQTDIPQKEVPLLLSTAEALQIKGLGVFSAGEGSDPEKSNCEPKKESSGVSRKRRSEPLVHTGLKEDSARANSNSTTLDNHFLENLYSHHYALMSTPKRRKPEERPLLKSPNFASSALCSSISDKTHSVEPSSPMIVKENGEGNSAQKTNQAIISSTLSLTTSTYSTLSHSPVHHSHIDSSKRSTSSQEPLHDPRPETKTASPRALNYTLAGLGGNKEDYSAGCLANILEESNAGLADTPENLMKAEVKEEALDFTNTALSEGLHGENIPLSTNSIEEETRIYLDAFTRSANLNKAVPLDEPQEMASSDGRPFSCPICHKCFAKAAILKRHHLAHFRPYVCHICTRAFTRREVLAEHLLEHNGADLRLPCPVCNMTIKRKRNLQAHIKVKHPDYYKQKIASRESLC